MSSTVPFKFSLYARAEFNTQELIRVILMYVGLFFEEIFLFGAPHSKDFRALRLKRKIHLVAVSANRTTHLEQIDDG